MARGIIALVLNVHGWTPPSDAAQRPVSYKVRKVVGSTSYWPGQILASAAVADLCNATGAFSITITEGE